MQAAELSVSTDTLAELNQMIQESRNYLMQLCTDMQMVCLSFADMSTSLEQILAMLIQFKVETGETTSFLGGLFSSLVDGVVTFGQFAQGVDKIGKVPEFFKTFGGAISNLTPLLSGLGVVFGAVSSAISAAFSLIMAHPIIAAITAFIAIVVVLYNKCEWFRDAVHAVFDAIKNTITGAVEGIQSFATMVGEGLANLCASIKDGFFAVIGWISEKLQALGSFLLELFRNIGSAIIGVAQRLLDAIINFKDWFLAIFQNILEFVCELPQLFYDIGAKMLLGLWEGIKSVLQTVINGIKNAVTSIVDGVKSILGIHSPSRIFMQIGEYMAKGLEVGWRDEIKGVSRALTASVPLTAGALPSASAQVPVQSTSYADHRTFNLKVDDLAVFQKMVRMVDEYEHQRMRTRAKGAARDNSRAF